MTNFIARIRRALGLAPKQSNEIWTEDQIAGLREFWNRSARKPPERSLTREPPSYDLSKLATIYALSKPAKQLYPFILGEPSGGWAPYWRHRNRRANLALEFAADQFARVVLEALHG